MVAGGQGRAGQASRAEQASRQGRQVEQSRQGRRRVGGRPPPSGVGAMSKQGRGENAYLDVSNN